MNIKRELPNLLRDSYEEEWAHTELRVIRDAQKPRFEALRDKHPEIYEDFMRAHSNLHVILSEDRKRRIRTLNKIIEELEK